MVLLARMTFKSAGVDFCSCCWLKFRLALSGMGEPIDNAVWSPLLLLPSIESEIENSIKFSFNSSLVKDFPVDFDLTCGTATALLAMDAADDLPLRWIVAINGWWSSFAAATVTAAGGNFVEFVPLFVLWLLLLMLLLLLFIVGGCGSVVCRPCSKHFHRKKKNSTHQSIEFLLRFCSHLINFLIVLKRKNF